MPRLPPELVGEIVLGVGIGATESDDSFRDLLSASRANCAFAERAFGRIWEAVDFSVRATSKLEEFRSEIVGRHGRRVTQVVLGADSTLRCSAADSEARAAFFQEVVPLLTSVRKLTLLGSHMLPSTSSSADTPPLLPSSFTHCITHLTLLNDADEVLEPSSIAILLRQFPNITSLACNNVGPSSTDDFTLAVQSLLQLSSLSFTNVKAFDSTFAFSPSWMVPLSNLFLSSVDSPQLALPFLHNFASTLTSLQIFFARSLEPDAPVHPLSFTSVPLPALTHCEIYINVVQLITKWIPLSLSPIESLVITGVRNDISYWDVLFPFVRGMRETLRELVVEVEEEGSGEAQSKASRKQLREHCRARKVALEVFLVQAD